MPQLCKNVNPHRIELYERSEYDMEMLKAYGQSNEQYRIPRDAQPKTKKNWYEPKSQGQPRHI